MKVSRDKDLFWSNKSGEGLSPKLLRRIDNYWEFVFARSLTRDVHYWWLRKSGRLQVSPAIDRPDKKMRLVAVAIIKGEDAYLQEWLAFHTLAGFEHFFIYDNGVSESTRKILGKNIAEGRVTYIPFPDRPGLRNHNVDLQKLCTQELAYGDFIRNYATRTDWFMQIDLDEFCYPTVDSGTDNLKSLLDELETHGVYSVEVNMLDFGSGWHREKPAGLVIENYRRCCSQMRGDVKTLALAREVKNLGYSHPHKLYYKNRLLKKIQKRSILKGAQANKLFRLNHYVTKSYEEFKKKCRLTGWVSSKYTFEKFFVTEVALNQNEDNGEIIRFLHLLKNRVKQTLSEAQ